MKESLLNLTLEPQSNGPVVLQQNKAGILLLICIPHIPDSSFVRNTREVIVSTRRHLIALENNGQQEDGQKGISSET